MYGGNEKRLDEIAAAVKQSVIGQDAAVDWLCTFVDAACQRTYLIKDRGLDAHALPNVGSAMLVGPTASGKSHLLKTFAREAGMLFHPIDGGQMTGEGWSGNSFSSQWLQVSAALDANPGRNALVFVDEVDKMFAKKDERNESFSPKFDLLKPLEGGVLRGRSDGRNAAEYALDCDRCVFVLAGAFTGIEDQVARRLGVSTSAPTQGIGFVAPEHLDEPMTESELRAQLSLDDLEAWGIPREIIGRISTLCFMAPLGEDALRRIVREVKQAEYGNMLPGAAFSIDRSAEDVLVERALAAHYGARSINQQLNSVVFGDLWREASKLGSIASVTVTANDGVLGYRLVAGDPKPSEAPAASEQERIAAQAAYGMLREMRAVLARQGGRAAFDPCEELGGDCATYAAALLCHAGGVDMVGGAPRVADDFSLAEITLLYALYALLSDWFPAADRTPAGIRTLLSMANDNTPAKSPLDLLFYQIEHGLRYVRDPKRAVGDDGEPSRNGWVWVKTNLVRNADGVRPGEVGGLEPGEDRALSYYTEFKGYPVDAQKQAVRSLAFRLL